MATIQREVRRRGFFGWVFLVWFWAFNALMAISMFVYWTQVAGMRPASNAEHAGAAIGATIGMGLVAFFWFASAVILGMFSVLTRGPKIIITEEES